MDLLRAVKGMNDILPEEMRRWSALERLFREQAARYGFGEIRTPALEPTALFVRSIGETTDIVEKEMYTFTDKGEHQLTLRPEGTASAVRAYLEHSIHAQNPVTKWFYLGPMFRRERPAKGRYRQFYQLGAEVFGDAGPYVDAEVIDMVVTFLEALGVQNVEVLVNSLGGTETRGRYREELVRYLEPFRSVLCGDCQRRMNTNPLRVLDCKVERDAEIASKAPSILEFLSADDQTHFQELTRLLDSMDTRYRVDSSLVRGLDYYTRTLFEVRGHGGELGAQNAVCGGGRYDNLVETLGGNPTPAIGFAMGIERLLLAAPNLEVNAGISVFVIAAQAQLRDHALRITKELRTAGFSVDCDLRGQSLKSQMRRADKSGARVALILGEDEVKRNAVQLRDLAKKNQIECTRQELIATVSRLLQGKETA